MSNQLQVVSDRIYALQPAFENRLVDRSINFEAEAGFALQILQQNEYALKIAATNKASLEAAITNIAAIGISLNPAKKEAYLVPRKGGICLSISYMGVMHMAQITGAILWGQARIVRLKDLDKFELRGIDQEPSHPYNPFDPDRGPIVGAYVVVKLPNGDYLTHAMPVADIYATRDRSDAWKAYKSKGNLCPWVTDEEEMIKKTVVHQAHKYWPSNDRLDSTLNYLNTDGGEGIELAPATNGAARAKQAAVVEPSEQQAELVSALEEIAAAGDMTALVKKFEAIGKPSRKIVGADEWTRIKNLCEAAEAAQVQAMAEGVDHE